MASTDTREQTQAITVRLKPNAAAALDYLMQEQGVNRTDAINAALIGAKRTYRNERMARQSRAAANDPVDVAECQAIAEMMEELSAPLD